MKNLFRLIKHFVLCVIIVCAVIIGFITYKGYHMYQEVISQTNLEEKVEQIQSSKQYVSIDEIPKDFKDAIIAVEDHRFYTHMGIDPIALSRAIITNIKTLSFAEGGSTITQQLAKNMYFSQKKELSRKIAEVFVVMELEKKYPKDKILEMYMNVVYFGDGLYGIREASLGYFDKEPKDLTKEECTLLAGLPNAPSVYALSNQTNLSYERQIQVIDAMVKYHFMDSEEAKEIKEKIKE